MRLGPVLDQIAAEKAGIIKVAKINAMTEQVLAAQFSIRGVPALFLYNNGQKVGEVAGAMSKQQLESWIASIVPL